MFGATSRMMTVVCGGTSHVMMKEQTYRKYSFFMHVYIQGQAKV